MIVRNFLLWKRGEKHTKNLPRETGKKKKKTPDHTKRGNSNVLAQGSFIRVLTVNTNPRCPEGGLFFSKKWKKEVFNFVLFYSNTLVIHS